MFYLQKGKTETERIVRERIIVMPEDPASDLTVDMAKQMFDSIENEAELATLFADVRNKAFWIIDDEDFYEPNTEEYKRAVKNRESWFELYDEIESRILGILEDEGVCIPETGLIIVLEPFMERNGYYNGGGWWLKKE